MIFRIDLEVCLFNEKDFWKLDLIVFYRDLVFVTQNQVLRKLVKQASSQNVKNQLQYSIYNTSWFTPWGVFLMIFSKIHTTFHTKFRLFSTICQVYQGFK